MRVWLRRFEPHRYENARLWKLVNDHLAFVPIIFAVLANIIIWIVSLVLLHAHPRLLGPAVLAYTYGLRHALDADHISAIDNLTRRLIEEGQRPVTVGLWFSLGHSTVVVMTCLVIAVTSEALADKFDNFQAIGGIIGTSISMSFLLLIGIANCFVLYRLLKSIRIEMRRDRLRQRYARAGHQAQDGIEPTETIKTNGILFRFFSRLFRLIDRPYKMYPLGILFGLGFDTSTEIALLGIASLQGSQGTSVSLIMVFPALFTVGMLLVDTIDGAGMYLAYTSDVFRGDRVGRLYYAIVLTGMSVIVALTIGFLQMFSLILNTANPTGRFWDGVAKAGDKYDVIGGCIVGAFISIVLVSALLHWLRRTRSRRRTQPEEVTLDGLDNPPSNSLDGQVVKVKHTSLQVDVKALQSRSTAID
ncbi:Putative uncharacterized protein [Taphrina deformans PYCC 5710]|uniref:Nickel/cobalt efflux system n=1 Tax=Taphrina deformans (strain PYCC 5710 / ATCC 11124 / CBS 356.35 / IMI 108563 / JCM 9778 / NBRC 8474) TaxID=1097556 RepID=R4X8P8_TAPDE|nr:Putative uncharacterized protein [Taphrina deformans PYCC 5710]|eukprot:CCG82013.1 Putative uncharacterized protein [Taphrina deformans PYCC 5710]